SALSHATGGNSPGFSISTACASRRANGATTPSISAPAWRSSPSSATPPSTPCSASPRSPADQPLFAIAKVPGTSQGGYMVYNGPRKLAHGESLEDVLTIFERK